MKSAASTQRETTKFAARLAKSGTPFWFYFAFCDVRGTDCFVFSCGRRKLSEALAMTEKVAEIVRAMEPRSAAA